MTEDVSSHPTVAMEVPRITNTKKADRWEENVVRAREEIVTPEKVLEEQPEITVGSHVMLRNPSKNFSRRIMVGSCHNEIHRLR